MSSDGAVSKQTSRNILFGLLPQPAPYASASGKLRNWARLG
jgi:hypothetical protein